MGANPWIMSLRPGRDRGRLCCFPHAGGSATAFFQFARLLPEEFEVVAVQYPGRGARLQERPLSNLEEVARGCVDGLVDAGWIEGGGYGFLGFSFGAAVSFAVALELERRGLLGPKFLALGGRLPPGERGRVDFVEVASRSDRDFVAALIELYGDPDGLLQHAEIVKMILPALRADMMALGSWRPSAEARVDAPITAFAGREDPGVREASLKGWSRRTTARLETFLVPGQHFVIDGSAHRVAREVAMLLQGLRPSS